MLLAEYVKYTYCHADTPGIGAESDTAVELVGVIVAAYAAVVQVGESADDQIPIFPDGVTR